MSQAGSTAGAAMVGSYGP
ncbi:hypothetical protein [Haladaptatus sp. DFWS20]